MVNHSVFIEELVEVGDDWRITVRELGLASVLAQEIFPYGAPHGVTVRDEIVITEPELVGSFLIGGLNSDHIGSMDEGYAEAFRNAGLTSYKTSLALEGSAKDGYVRTWFAGNDDPWDMPEDEAAELYVDNWTNATMSAQLTVWDLVDDQTITFHYANSMEYEVVLSTIEQSQMPAERLLNHHNFLVIPTDESFQPVLTARTCPNMFALRVALNDADRKMKDQQLEIGFLVNEFQNAIRDLAKGGRWKSPVDTFRGGLRK